MFVHDLGDGAELHPLEPWQAEEFAAHADEVRAHIAPWVPFGTYVVDVDRAREMLQRFADAQARDEGRLNGIWLDGVLSGGTVFRTFDTRTGTCELGAWLPGAEGRMTLEGTLRSSFVLGGVRRDCEVWAVLADEWRAARAT